MYSTLEAWIQNEAVPFSLDSTGDAAAQILAALGTPRILALGEGIHGGEEILLLRNRLFQQLVEQHGYGAIAIESSFPRGRAVNEYVLGRGPRLEDALREGFSHGFGSLDANRELVEWMRAYNRDPGRPQPVHFYGFDSPTEMTGTDSPSHVLHFALDYLAELDPSSAAGRREVIDALLGEDIAWENPAVLMDPSQGIGLSEAAAALRVETEELVSELEIRRPELVARSTPERYWEARQHALMARQLLTYHAGLARASERRLSNLLGIRDAMMADNLAYIAGRERGGVLAFAQNRHMQRGPVQWILGPNDIRWWPAGAHLRELLGSSYAVIGTGLGVSEENGIGEPAPGTLEARLSAAPGPLRFILTHQGQGLPQAEIAGLPTRVGSSKNFTYMPLDARSFSDFDGLIVLDSVRYSQGGPPLPEV